jgi:hypothetical protein
VGASDTKHHGQKLIFRGSSDERQLLEAVLARLVALGGSGGATRRVAGREEFDGAKRTNAEKLTTEHCGRRLLDWCQFRRDLP